MNDEFRTLRATDDRAPLAALVRRAFPEEPDAATMLDALLDGRDSVHVTVEVLVLDGRPAGLAVASHDGCDGTVELLVVDASCRRRGHGRALLTKIEERLADRGVRNVRAGGRPPRYLWPGVSVLHIDALAMLLSGGYRNTGTVCDLAVDLRRMPAEAVTTGTGTTVGRVREEDHLPAWVQRHFGQPWASEVALAERRGTALVAREPTGELVGFVAWGVSRPHVLGPIAVRERSRRGGEGAALLHEALQCMAREGRGDVTIGWTSERAVPFYRREAAATVATTYFILEKELT